MSRTARSIAALAGLSLAGPLLALTGGSAAGAESVPYTVTTLHFKIGLAGNKLGDPNTCDVVGDLYLPKKATKTTTVPAILTTNGFGGSKDDQAGFGKYFASHGYAVLSYSGLGFGGSTCKVTLDDPSTDGQAAKRLISYLGGKEGVAFTDAKHTTPAPTLQVITRDATDHDGDHEAHDPRVGMIGGSYGGEIQFATASVDPRLDTIVPMITWNDLSYSLGPNNTDQTTGVSTKTPGAVKLAWGLAFSALGMVDGVQNVKGDPTRLIPCPNFASFVCPALITGGTTGYFNAGTVKSMRHASVVDYIQKIKIPTFLLQGQGDTLFNLNEAAATYAALRKQGTVVKMIWHSWGHSVSTPQPGEFDSSNPDPKTQYETRRVVNWFYDYLKGHPETSTGSQFSYFRDWVSYSGDAGPAFGHSNDFPVGTDRSLYLSGSSLTTDADAIATGTQRYVTPPAGVPTRFDKLDALGGLVKLPLPEQDAPGTSVTWTSPALTDAWDVVGSPKLTLKVAAPLATGGTPATDLVGFARIEDVAPDGTATQIRDLTAPFRVPSAKQAFTVTMPAFVHQFAPGHKIRLVLSGGSLNYRGGLIPSPVTIATGSKTQVLQLPVTN